MGFRTNLPGYILLELRIVKDRPEMYYTADKRVLLFGNKIAMRLI